MMEFASRGFLKLDSVVPDAINQQFLSDIGHVDGLDVAHPRDHYRDVMATSTIPVVNAGVPLSDAYPADSALGKLLGLPLVTGAIQSLVGRRPLFDHHFLHIAFPPRFNGGTAQVSQHTHQDSTIDPRRSFDVQLMYYPHEVTKDMGGTRYIPGSHLRIVSEASIGRYQNILGQQHLTCNAGTLLFMHMGIWHGGGSNRSENMRYMFKVRICPTERQVRLWDDSDLPEDHNRQRPIFWTGVQDPQHLHSTLTTPEPWFEADTARLEYLNRIRFWRYLLGDNSFDADYWLTRVENEIN
ncbi:MAG TPA: phytanoyl-CoA dioxygenase [Pseudomonadales bacterium]|nr:phytanoyl-CoA dioxygenase [Pseudomonadales bacterium]